VWRHNVAECNDKGKSPLVARIERELTRRIADGAYQANSYIPPERKLARELGASRLTIATALGRMVKAGLVVRNPGRGTRVLAPWERLAHPLVGVIHGLSTTSGEPHRTGSFATLQGALNVLQQVGCPHEVVTATWSADSCVEELLQRFGAFLFIELPPDAVEAAMGIERRRAPLVVAKLEGRNHLDISATFVDHRLPTQEAVRFLSNLGHRRIAYVTRDPEFAFYGDAHEGYLNGLKEAGVPRDESLIAIAERTDALSGYFAAEKLLMLDDPPTAFVAARSTLAEGVCQAIERAGLLVGHHVSVVGFDDTTWPREDPILTTFDEPCHEMGVTAARMLMERIVNGWRPPQKRRLDTPFILRRSAGPPLPMPLAGRASARAGADLLEAAGS